jgi:two-component system cell cycle sensor histidine kinase/response regulator CckA
MVSLLVDDDTRVAEDRLQRTNHLESLATLVGGIAHDLNNALAPIRLALDMLPRITDPKQMDFILKTVKTGIDRGAAMIRQIQTFAHGQEGDRVSLSIRDIVQEVETKAKQTLPANIEWKVSLASGLGRILGDAKQLCAALGALVTNAVEAMPNGGRLLIEASNTILQQSEAHSRSLNPGNYIHLRVVDTGTGISPAIREKAIDPFFTTKPNGAGLGLSTAYGIIKNHGGILEVTSGPKGGAQAIVYLPCQDQPSDKPKPEELAPIERGCGEEILVIDYDEPIRNMIVATLTDFGYKPIPLAGLKEGEAVPASLMAASRVAIVATDMDGQVTWAKIEALLAQKSTLKIIAMKCMNIDDCERKKLSNCFSVLEKPFSAQDLIRNVNLALRQS